MKIILINLLLLFSISLIAQKTLILEKLNNNTKQIRFYIGEPMTFQTIENPGIWQEYFIKDLIVEANTIFFENGQLIKIDDIAKVKINKEARTGKLMGATFMYFAIPFTVYTGINALSDEEVNSFHYITGGSAWLLAFVIPRLKTGIYKMKKHRLRIFSTENLGN